MSRPTRVRGRLAAPSPLIRLLSRFASENLPQVAASLAFTTLLSLVPLVTLILAVAGLLPALQPLLASLDLLVSQTLLPSGVAGAVSGNISKFSHKAQGLTLPGLALLGVSAFLLMHTIERAFNHLWQVRPRAMWVRIRLYALVILVWPFVLAGLIAALSYAVTVSLGFFNEPAWLARRASGVLLFGLLGALLSLLYYAVPNARVSKRAALFAGFLAMAAFLGLQKVFELFLVRSAFVKSVYGAFATFPVFLVWLHFSWMIVLFGGLLAASFSPNRGPRPGGS